MLGFIKKPSQKKKNQNNNKKTGVLGFIKKKKKKIAALFRSEWGYLKEVPSSHGELGVGGQIRGVDIGECDPLDLVPGGHHIAVGVGPWVQCEVIHTRASGDTQGCYFFSIFF